MPSTCCTDRINAETKDLKQVANNFRCKVLINGIVLQIRFY